VFFALRKVLPLPAADLDVAELRVLERRPVLFDNASSLLLSELSLCLSRAWLGKMILFSVKWHCKR
jgi:hypothetical protein